MNSGTSSDKPTIIQALKIICLDFQNTDRDPAALDLLRRAIESGDNPNWWYRDGGNSFNALSLLASCSRNILPVEKLNSMIKAARLIIEAGANPFDRFDDVFGGRSAAFRSAAIAIYAEKEINDAPTLDSHGQSLLHYPQIWDALKNIKAPQALPLGWVNAQRKGDLMTPTHVMWQHALQYAKEKKMQPNYVNIVVLTDLFEKTAILIQAGARLDLQNHQGVSVASYIDGQIKQYGLKVRQSGIKKSTWSFIEAQLMRENTVGSPTPTRAMRL